MDKTKYHPVFRQIDRTGRDNIGTFSNHRKNPSPHNILNGVLPNRLTSSGKIAF